MVSKKRVLEDAGSAGSLVIHFAPSGFQFGSVFGPTPGGSPLLALSEKDSTFANFSALDGT